MCRCLIKRLDFLVSKGDLRAWGKKDKGPYSQTKTVWEARMKWCQTDLRLAQSQICFTAVCVCVCTQVSITCDVSLFHCNIPPARTAPVKPQRPLIMMTWYYSESYWVKQRTWKFSTGKTYISSNQSRIGQGIHRFSGVSWSYYQTHSVYLL